LLNWTSEKIYRIEWEVPTQQHNFRKIGRDNLPQEFLLEVELDEEIFRKCSENENDNYLEWKREILGLIKITKKENIGDFTLNTMIFLLESFKNSSPGTLKI